MNKHRRLRLLSALMATVIGFTLLSAGTSVAAKTQSELEQEQQDLLAEANKWAGKYEANEATIEEKEAYQKTLERQIANIEAQMNLIKKEIGSLNADLKEADEKLSAKEAEIAAREAEIAADFAKLQQRLRAISKSGNMSGLQMLFSTKDYTDYLYKNKIMQCIAENDEALMEALEAEISKIHEQMDAISAERAEVEEKKADVEKLKAKQQKKADQVDALYEEVEKVIRDLESDSAYYKAQQKKYEKEAAAIDRQIANLIGNANATNTSKYRGSMTWPTPGYYTISSYYGPRWGTIHRGIDITGKYRGEIYNANIYAAADGVVSYINRSDRWGSTYGYYVIIDHGKDENGNTVASLYAHMNSVAGIQVGQQVTGGKTVLGYVGSTGNSTGYHLHFEIRVNGAHTNPIPKYVNPKNG